MTTGPKTARRTVGQSTDRTPGKHAMLNRLTGKVVGAATRLPFINCNPMYLLDLCAGNGIDTDSSKTCSPAILMKHASFGRHPERWHPPAARGLDLRTIFIERDRVSFDLLRASVAAKPDYNPQRDLVIHGDSRLPETIPDLLYQGSAVVHNDPNTVNDWALTSDLLGRLPRYTMTVSTLGCNVGGLLRLSYEQRQPWFENVESVLNFKPRHHDAYLVALLGDASKFAWLITAPTVWQNDVQTIFRSAFKAARYDTRDVWLAQDPDGFTDLTRELFHTKAERSE